MKPQPDDFLAPAYRRRLVAVLLPISILNFADRAVFSALAQTIKADMKLTDLQLGLLQGLLFALLYAVVGLPIGRLAERVSRTRIIAAAATVWSVATIFTGMGTSFVHLAAARLAVGMGEAGFTPATASLVADVTPPTRRASTMAIILLGSPIGAFAGATMAGLIAGSFGWRAAFFAFGLPGLAAAGLLLMAVREPPRGLADGDLRVGAPVPPMREFIAAIRSDRSLQWIMAGGSLAGFGMTSISQFMAVFLARVHHLGVRDAAAAFGTVSGLSLTAGLLIGSFGTDYLSRRDPRWPAWGAAIGLACAPPVYLLAFHTVGLAGTIALLIAGGSFLLMFYGPTTAMIQNMLPPRMRASGVALYTLLFTVLGSGLGPVFVGAASDWFGAREYGLGYAVDCPHGLPMDGATAARIEACARASAAGIQSALSVAVLVFFVAALCFMAGAASRRASSSENRVEPA